MCKKHIINNIRVGNIAGGGLNRLRLIPPSASASESANATISAPIDPFKQKYETKRRTKETERLNIE